jgi:hypothetical protein
MKLVQCVCLAWGEVPTDNIAYRELQLKHRQYWRICSGIVGIYESFAVVSNFNPEDGDSMFLRDVG